jgi:hypothetical protein
MALLGHTFGDTHESYEHVDHLVLHQMLELGMRKGPTPDACAVVAFFCYFADLATKLDWQINHKEHKGTRLIFVSFLFLDVD